MAIYRSAHGKPVDIAQLATKFEKVRAVGNMNVNARGDVIDNNNKVVKDNTNRVKNTYNRSVGKNPSVQQANRKAATQAGANIPFTNTTVTPVPELSANEKELFDELDDFNEQEIQEIKKEKK
jgi:hypothetical protein